MFYLCIVVNDQYRSIRFLWQNVKVEDGTVSRLTEYFHRGVEFKNGKIIGRLESNFSKFASHVNCAELSARREREIRRSLESMKDRARQSSRHGKVASIQWNFSTSDSRLRDLRVFGRVFLPIDGNVDQVHRFQSLLTSVDVVQEASFLLPSRPFHASYRWNIDLAIFESIFRWLVSTRERIWRWSRVEQRRNGSSSLFIHFFQSLSRLSRFRSTCIANLSLRNDTCLIIH